MHALKINQTTETKSGLELASGFIAILGDITIYATRRTSDEKSIPVQFAVEYYASEAKFLAGAPPIKDEVQVLKNVVRTNIEKEKYYSGGAWEIEVLTLLQSEIEATLQGKSEIIEINDADIPFVVEQAPPFSKPIK